MPPASVFTITPQHESIYASMRTQGSTCHTLQNTDTQVHAHAEPDSGQPHLIPHTHPSQDARAVGRRTHGHRQGTRTLAHPIAAHTRGAGRRREPAVQAPSAPSARTPAGGGGDAAARGRGGGRRERAPPAQRSASPPRPRRRPGVQANGLAGPAGPGGGGVGGGDRAGPEPRCLRCRAPAAAAAAGARDGARRGCGGRQHLPAWGPGGRGAAAAAAAAAAAKTQRAMGELTLQPGTRVAILHPPRPRPRLRIPHHRSPGASRNPGAGAWS